MDVKKFRQYSVRHDNEWHNGVVKRVLKGGIYTIIQWGPKRRVVLRDCLRVPASLCAAIQY